MVTRYSLVPFLLLYYDISAPLQMQLYYTMVALSVTLKSIVTTNYIFLSASTAHFLLSATTTLFYRMEESAISYFASSQKSVQSANLAVASMEVVSLQNL
jgi:hypothetical protein